MCPSWTSQGIPAVQRQERPPAQVGDAFLGLPQLSWPPSTYHQSSLIPIQLHFSDTELWQERISRAERKEIESENITYGKRVEELTFACTDQGIPLPEGSEEYQRLRDQPAHAGKGTAGLFHALTYYRRRIQAGVHYQNYPQL